MMFRLPSGLLFLLQSSSFCFLASSAVSCLCKTQPLRCLHSSAPCLHAQKGKKWHESHVSSLLDPKSGVDFKHMGHIAVLAVWKTSFALNFLLFLLFCTVFLHFIFLLFPFLLPCHFYAAFSDWSCTDKSVFGVCVSSFDKSITYQWLEVLFCIKLSSLPKLHMLPGNQSKSVGSWWLHQVLHLVLNFLTAKNAFCCTRTLAGSTPTKSPSSLLTMW